MAYGAIKETQSKPMNGMAMGLGDIAACLIVPLLIFTVVFYVRGMFIHYSYNSLHYLICAAMLLIVLTFGGMAFASKKMSVALVFGLSLIGWLAGFFAGQSNYLTNTQPYYDTLNLNSYYTVDPSAYTGQQLMDAGQIEFVPGTHIDLKKSYGFKNDNVYCIAPIMGPKAKKSKDKKTKGPEIYDFWAVGLNCCSGHAPDFRCGEFDNPHARKGLRLMRDDERDFYRLAVQEAEAAYNIRANFPVFMYWMEKPSDELNSYYEDASNLFTMGVGAFAALEFAVVVLMVVALNK